MCGDERTDIHTDTHSTHRCRWKTQFDVGRGCCGVPLWNINSQLCSIVGLAPGANAPCPCSCRFMFACSPLCHIAMYVMYVMHVSGIISSGKAHTQTGLLNTLSLKISQHRHSTMQLGWRSEGHSQQTKCLQCSQKPSYMSPAATHTHTHTQCH